MTDAYHASSALEAEAALLALATGLDRAHPGAAASLREGLDETLTVLRLNVAPTLARTLRSTNCIESMISVRRDHARNVKRWRDGQMALRWCATGMIEAGKQFRRVNGHLHLSTLRAALGRETAKSVGLGVTVISECSLMLTGPRALVTKVDDQVIQNAGTLCAAVQSHAPGARVTVGFIDPSGDPRTVPVTLGTDHTPLG
jgi:hypothetical protein